MLRTFNKPILVLLFCSSLGACSLTDEPKNEHRITFEQTPSYGFTNTEIVELGRLVLIDYYQFDTDSANANPSFPDVDAFPSDSALLARYLPLANIQGRDKVDTGEEELYGHVWRDQDSAGLVVSVRGTSDRQEWIDDAKFRHVKLETGDMPNQSEATTVEVELGFHEIERSFTMSSQPGTSERTPLASYIDAQSNVKSLTIVGHSLGSSLATLFAYKTKLRRPELDIRLLTFASPLTGAPSFSASFENQFKKSIRIVNRPDIVPKMPFPELGYKHVWHPLMIDSGQNQKVVDSLACHHSLNTYLHMIDSTVELTKECTKLNK